MRDWNGGHIFRSGTHVAIKAIPKQQAGGGTKPKLSIFDFSRLWRNYFGFCHHPNAKIHENTLKFHCPCSEQTRIWLSSQIPNTKQGVTEITNTLPDLLTKNAIPHNPLWNRHFRLSTRPTWRKRLNLNGCLDKETYNTSEPAFLFWLGFPFTVMFRAHLSYNLRTWTLNLFYIFQFSVKRQSLWYLWILHSARCTNFKHRLPTKILNYSTWNQLQ